MRFKKSNSSQQFKCQAEAPPREFERSSTVKKMTSHQRAELLRAAESCAGLDELFDPADELASLPA